MKPRLLVFRTRHSLHNTCFAATWLSSLLLAGAADPFIGNQSIVPKTFPAEPGNLTIAGDLSVSKGIDLGVSTGNGALSAFQMDWYSATKNLSFDLTDSSSSFTWRDNLAGGAAVRNKMKLDDTNSLSLFKSDGSAAGIKLDPTSGAVTLAGLNSGIYNSAGNAMVSFSASGAVTFPTRPLFSDGIDFGSGKILNTHNVGYMRDLITNFGYQENPVTPTPISQYGLVNVSHISVAEGPAGSVYLVGSYNNGAVLGQGLSEEGVVLCRFSSANQLMWRAVLPGSSASGVKVAVDSSGNPVVGCSLTDASIGAGGNDTYVAKYNVANGALLWKKRIGGTGGDSVGALAVGSDGSVSVAGIFDGSTTAANDGIVFTGAGSQDGYVVKLNGSTGAEVWKKRIGGTNYDDVRALAVASDGSVSVAGSFNGSTTTANDGIAFTGAGGQDGYVVKLNGITGAEVWKKRIGGTVGDSVDALAVTSDGSVSVAGSFNGSTTAANDGIAFTGGSALEGYVVKLDSNTGAEVWKKRIGGTSADAVSTLAVASDGSVSVAGYISGPTMASPSRVQVPKMAMW
jgi:trimeric autotransporter adhesin